MPTTYIIGHQKPDTDSVVSALAAQYLFEQLDCFHYQQPQAAIVDDINHETRYLLDKFSTTAPPIITARDIKKSDQVVLVDHNEKSQRLPGLDEAQICEIIDHHKPNLSLSRPIFLNFKTWGATVSVIYFIMQHFGSQPLQPNKNLAALMLGAILSDTVGFKSSTTTDKDQQIAQELAQIAGITDIDAFALAILKAKSDLSHLSPLELIKHDAKTFDFGQKLFIGQLETVEQSDIIQQKKDALLQAMQTVKQQEEADLIFLAVSDVLKVNTKLLAPDKISLKTAEQAFNTKAKDNVIDIGAKISRKKDIVPALETVLNN